MSAEHNKALVRRYYEELWNRWDFPLAHDHRFFPADSRDVCRVDWA